ncbi:10172_t:CDS:2 [Acaulospora morrowiae]|uniref:10172_t:CDS:1 n=1 Tax=Acaulospora morrowiae TaxID=94023 RepID=A0A9N9AST9_9GLOM|nr:10172_t:CDS:2 [Acaulospora morrowiae]
MAFDLRKIARFLGPFIITIQLIVAVILFNRVRPFPPPPKQELSGLTNLPIWEASPDDSITKTAAANLAEIIAAIIGGIATLACIFIKLSNGTFNPNPPTDDNIWTKYLFNTLISVYVSVTFLAVIAGAIISVGKLWSIIGIFHNIMEVCIVANLLHKSNFSYVSGLITIVIYSATASAITSQLDWYWDDMFFKFQGKFIYVLCSKHKPTQAEIGESAPLLGGSSGDNPYKGSLLILASTVHLIGNISNVVGNNSNVSSIIFFGSYFFAFPLYAFYVHKAQKNHNFGTVLIGISEMKK